MEGLRTATAGEIAWGLLLVAFGSAAVSAVVLRQALRVDPSQLARRPPRSTPRPAFTTLSTVTAVHPRMTSDLADVLQGFRLLRRTPVMAWTVVATLGLGIAAATALFTVVSTVVLAPLPFPDAARLVQVWRSELPALTYGSASYARYLDWRKGQRGFTDLGVWAPRGLTMTAGDGAERLSGATISASFFEALGVAPVVGRLFADGDDRRGAAPVALLSEGLWVLLGAPRSGQPEPDGAAGPGRDPGTRPDRQRPRRGPRRGSGRHVHPAGAAGVPATGGDPARPRRADCGDDAGRRGVCGLPAAGSARVAGRAGDGAPVRGGRPLSDAGPASPPRSARDARHSADTGLAAPRRP